MRASPSPAITLRDATTLPGPGTLVFSLLCAAFLFCVRTKVAAESRNRGVGTAMLKAYFAAIAPVAAEAGGTAAVLP